jgi:putative molybdopterin biosynthesis protein
MHNFGVRLNYDLDTLQQQGAAIEHPLFQLLGAVHAHGSIRAAAIHLGVSYRYAWGSLKSWELALGQPLIEWEKGRAARLTQFAERLTLAEARARVRLTPQIEALRAELQHALAFAFDESQSVLTIYASHDLALPALRDLAADKHRLHIDLKFSGSVDCLRALNAGQCLVAGFHISDDAGRESQFARAIKPLLKPGLHKVLGYARRTQGLMIAKGNPLGIKSLNDVADGQVRFLNRQPGSATRLLTEHLFGQAKIDATRVNGFERYEDTHVAAAHAVAGGLADAAIGIEAAARAEGLDFLPLISERYFLACMRDALEHPAVIYLRNALSSPDWSRALLSQPGYAPLHPGEVLPLTRVLPWWAYRTEKPR